MSASFFAPSAMDVSIRAPVVRPERCQPKAGAGRQSRVSIRAPVVRPERCAQGAGVELETEGFNPRSGRETGAIRAKRAEPVAGAVSIRAPVVRPERWWRRVSFRHPPSFNPRSGRETGAMRLARRYRRADVVSIRAPVVRPERCSSIQLLGAAFLFQSALRS